VAQGVGLAARPTRAVRYGLQEYNQIEAQIFGGMQAVLGHQNSFIRDGFATMLYELHLQGWSASVLKSIYYTPLTSSTAE